MTKYTTLKVSSDSLGNHLGGLRDLTQQLGDLLANPAPGGVVAKRDELVGMIAQAQQLVDEATSQLDELDGLTGLLTQHLSIILGALSQVGFTKIEFGGPSATVVSEHAQALQEGGGVGAVYGFTLLATTPDAQVAIGSLLGAGQAITGAVTGIIGGATAGSSSSTTTTDANGPTTATTTSSGATP